MLLDICKIQEKHLKNIYEIRFSVTENLPHPHQIQYLQRQHALDDLKQGGGWICKVGVEYAGYGFGIFVPEALVGGLFVKPEFQNEGIGSHLLQNITQWFKERGALSAVLTTDKASKAADFYRRKGWFAEGMDEFGQLIMRKEI